MFDPTHSRFATFGVISSLPGELIDSVWMIIDQNLQGVVDLHNLLTFAVENHDGQVTMHFSQEDDPTELSVDLPFDYQPSFPAKVMAYDDGNRQTILLPSEGKREGNLDL